MKPEEPGVVIKRLKARVRKLEQVAEQARAHIYQAADDPNDRIILNALDGVLDSGLDPSGTTVPSPSEGEKK